MKRSLMTFVLVALCSAGLHADVTVTTSTTLEGGLSAMAGGLAPRIVLRIKGMKVRTDIDVMGQAMSTVADLTTRHIVVLRADEKTARIVEVPQAPTGTPAVTLPKTEGTFNATGRSQVIDGVKCDEYTFAMTVAMDEMGASPQMPPEAAGMLQGMKMIMNGSVWTTKIGPGAAEYIAFQKAAMNAQLGSLLSGGMNGMSSSGMERLMKGLSGGEGMPYLTEMNMTFDGAGPLVDMMKQMGGMKITSKVTSVSTNAIPDDTFTIPSDYTIVKQ